MSRYLARPGLGSARDHGSATDARGRRPRPALPARRAGDVRLPRPAGRRDRRLAPDPLHPARAGAVDDRRSVHGGAARRGRGRGAGRPRPRGRRRARPQLGWLPGRGARDGAPRAGPRPVAGRPAGDRGRRRLRAVRGAADGPDTGGRAGEGGRARQACDGRRRHRGGRARVVAAGLARLLRRPGNRSPDAGRHPAHRARLQPDLRGHPGAARRGRPAGPRRGVRRTGGGRLRPRRPVPGRGRHRDRGGVPARERDRRAGRRPLHLARAAGLRRRRAGPPRHAVL